MLKDALVKVLETLSPRERKVLIMRFGLQDSKPKTLEEVGREFKVLIDRVEGDYYIGRSEFDSPEVDNEILVGSEEKLQIGNFYRIRIERAEFFDLYGTVIK